MQAVSDEQLIQWVADGDASCLGTLFERHHRGVYQYCLQLTRSPAVSEDLVQGEGPELAPGATASVQYVGVSWSTGREFDASWDRGQPFGFPVGAGRVIAGWDQGVVGMRAGGRRLLVIPPHLGYGDRGAGDVIAPGGTQHVEWDDETVYLTGWAEVICDGAWSRPTGG